MLVLYSVSDKKRVTMAISSRCSVEGAILSSLTQQYTAICYLLQWCDFKEESIPAPHNPKLTHYLDQVDLMLSTEGLHQLDVHGLIAVGCKDAQVGLTPAQEGWIKSFWEVMQNLGIIYYSLAEGKHLTNSLVQGFGSLTDTTGKAVVDECGLEHFRESGVDIHHTSSSNAIDK